MNMQNIVSKLNLIGKTVLAYNDFGIVCRSTQGNLRLLKFTQGELKEIDDISKYHLSDNFIVIENTQLFGKGHCSLYIKESEDSISYQNDQINSVFLGGSPNSLDAPRDKDTKICFYETTLNHIRAVNSKGDTIDISDLIYGYEESPSFEIYRYTGEEYSKDTGNKIDIYLVIVIFFRYAKGLGEIRHCVTLIMDEDLNILEIDR